MASQMEQAPLWQRTFADCETDPTVSRLVNSLRSARERVASLTSRIVASLPSLTIHDTSHLDALWGVASTIAGEDYVLNPLEGYLFGTAVLLHDSALCHEAYVGGQQAVRSTVQWKDAHSRQVSNLGSADLDAVDFEALRSLHATQAAALATTPWSIPGEDPEYIIDDHDLRTQYGPLIGELASSHHWNMEHVAERFSGRRPPAPFLHPDWTADPLKVACLLRTADAGHMDSSRAPTFLLKALQLNAISKAHWVAQNHLGQLTVKIDDPTQLIVASTAPFQVMEASAWWVAFDLVVQFDKELKQCDAVLRSAPGGTPRTFARRGVAGAGSARELVQFIQTQGWEPTDSAVHVSDVAALVGRLGGDQLYGKQTGNERLRIVLRELVQNAADAVSARRLIGEATFVGHIRIRLRQEGGNRQILQVDDDGVGMSPTTLSEDLLDFGKSFWTSERASSEFPGIQAAKHSPIGRFGIGFFSIFMAATKVRVFSRRFDRGLEEVRCLSFDNGLSLRPTLTDERPADFGMNVSSRVELELKPSTVFDPNRLKVPNTVSGQQPFHVAFDHYVAALVCGIDVPISVEFNGDTRQVNGGFPPRPEDRVRWLHSLSYVPAGVNQPAVGLARLMSPRLREIRDGEICHGLAAIRTNRAAAHDFLSAKSVGGFATHDTHGSFVGLIDHLPQSARREPGEMAAPRHAIDAWLAEQVALLDGLSDPDSVLASYSLCDFDHDPIDVLRGIIVIGPSGNSFWLLSELGALLKGSNRLAFRVSEYGDTRRLEQYGEQHTIPGVATCLVMGNGKFNEADISGNVPQKPRSLIGVVHRTLIAQGAKPSWTIRQGLYRGPFGRCDCLEVSI